jgi:hypothetical protein
MTEISNARVFRNFWGKDQIWGPTTVFPKEPREKLDESGWLVLY